MFRKVLFLAAVLFMALSLSAWAEEPDYGNDCNSAEPIDPNGTIVEGILSDTSDQDWFSFTASADGLYEIAFLSQSGSKNLYVYGPDGCPDQLQQIVGFDASTGTVTNEVFIESAGTYYIKIYYSTGLYRVSVNLVSQHLIDTYPDTCTSPAALIVDDPPMYDGITDYGIDEDWFTFATSILHKYQVNFYRPLNSDAVYDLYRSDCGDALSSGRTGSITFVSLDGANYDLRVKSSSFNKEGYYEIWVDDLGEVPEDYNNTCDGATPIPTDGTEVEGRLQYTADLFSDADWFSFTASADGLYEMTFLSQSGTKYMYVYGPDGCPDALQQIVYLSADTGTVTNEVFIESPGTYYIQIPSGYSTGLYRVSVAEVGTYPTDTYPDTCDDPCELVVDDPCGPVYDGITDYGIDEDWLTFATDVLHKYQVSFYSPMNTDVVYGLHESDCGAQLYSGTASRTFVSWDAANYDLRVKSSSFNNEGYYEIWVDDLGEVPDDYGNSCDDATPIATNGTDVNGVLDYTADFFSDEDWFSFTAPVTGTYQICICLWSQSATEYLEVYGPNQSVSSQPPNVPWEYLEVYGPNQCGPEQKIAEFNTSSYYPTPCKDISISNVGTYYIRVYRTRSGLYGVSVLSPVPQCGDPDHPYPSGDMNHDCVVNFVDFAMIANNWLADTRP